MAGRHRRPVRRFRLVRVVLVLAAIASLVTGIVLAASSPPAPVLSPAQHAVLASSTESLGGRILDKAETQIGCWYFYGHAGPCRSGYDCSGLVYWAATALGLKNFPRDTYELLSAGVRSGRLVRTYHPQRGDLAFYGTGHVEDLTVWYHTTFGAQDWGTRVGWHRWSGWWQPTAFYRIAW